MLYYNRIDPCEVLMLVRQVHLKDVFSLVIDLSFNYLSVMVAMVFVDVY